MSVAWRGKWEILQHSLEIGGDGFELLNRLTVGVKAEIANRIRDDSKICDLGSLVGGGIIN